MLPSVIRACFLTALAVVVTACSGEDAGAVRPSLQPIDLEALGWERTQTYPRITAARFRGDSALLVGWGGEFLRIDGLGASSFQVQMPMRSYEFSGMEFTEDGQRGLLIDIGGRFYATEDGGRSWAESGRLGIGRIEWAEVSMDLSVVAALSDHEMLWCDLIVRRVDGEPGSHQYAGIRGACISDFFFDADGETIWVYSRHYDPDAASIAVTDVDDLAFQEVCEHYDEGDSLDLPDCADVELPARTLEFLDPYDSTRSDRMEHALKYGILEIDDNTLQEWVAAGEIDQEDGRYWAFLSDTAAWSEDGQVWNAVYRRVDIATQTLEVDSSGIPSRLLGGWTTWTRESELVWSPDSVPEDRLGLSEVYVLEEAMIGGNLFRLSRSTDDGRHWATINSLKSDEETYRFLSRDVFSRDSGEIPLIGIRADGPEFTDVYYFNAAGDPVPLDWRSVSDGNIGCSRYCWSVKGDQLIIWLPADDGSIEEVRRATLPASALEDIVPNLLDQPVFEAWFSDDAERILLDLARGRVLTSLNGGEDWQEQRFHPDGWLLLTGPSEDVVFLVVIEYSTTVARFGADGFRMLGRFDGEFELICASDDGEQIFVPSEPTVLSLDGGVTWHRSPFESHRGCHITEDLWWFEDAVWRRVTD